MKNKIIIAVQGDRGSFSEQAADQYCQNKSYQEIKYHYAISSQGVMESLRSGNSDIGIVAIYNTSGGVVDETQIMLDQAKPKIQEILSLDVRQNLLVLPGISFHEIKTIRSHSQALKQCQNYLEKNFPHADIIETKDTALAARDLSMAQDSSSAVIGCITAANTYGLIALEKNIQDSPKNQTVFAAISN